MNKRGVHIENLNIRIPGGSAGNGRALAGELGRKILHNIAHVIAGESGSKKIGEISVVNNKVVDSSAGSDLCAQIARDVANEVRKKIVTGEQDKCPNS